MITGTVSLALRMEAELGEGPVWLADQQALWFVDIVLGRLHCFEFCSGVSRTIDVGGKPSFVVPIAGGGLMVGNGLGLHRLEGDRLGQTLARLDEPAANRTNDATVDNHGRLWFGTMDGEERQSTGTLFCYDRGRITRTVWQATVTNGPAISCCGAWLYHVDSVQRVIWRIALADGVLSEVGEVFVRFEEKDGHPDGVVVDSEDCLWVALWDGWSVHRYSPSGERLQEITMPCARVTKIAFGGPDLKTAFVTTARTGLADSVLASQPLAGSLFSFEAPAPGRLLCEVAGPLFEPT